MTLGELIKTLEALDPNMVLSPGFGEAMSYRGYYEQLAFTPEESVVVKDALKEAKAALGQTFTGYKGGDYTMHEFTECWIAGYGDCGDPLTLDRLRLSVALNRLRRYEPEVTAESLLENGAK